MGLGSAAVSLGRSRHTRSGKARNTSEYQWSLGNGVGMGGEQRDGDPSYPVPPPVTTWRPSVLDCGRSFWLFHPQQRSHGQRGWSSALWAARGPRPKRSPSPALLLLLGPARCGWWSGDSCGSPRKRGANACTECEYRVSHSEQSHELFWTGQCRSG